MDYENQQACGTCQQTKPLTCFPKNRAKKSGHGAKCKDCRKAYYRDWYSKNRASVIAATKRYYADNRRSSTALGPLPYDRRIPRLVVRQLQHRFRTSG